MQLQQQQQQSAVDGKKAALASFDGIALATFSWP